MKTYFLVFACNYFVKQIYFIFPSHDNYQTTSSTISKVSAVATVVQFPFHCSMSGIMIDFEYLFFCYFLSIQFDLIQFFCQFVASIIFVKFYTPPPPPLTRILFFIFFIICIGNHRFVVCVIVTITV